MSGKSNNGGVYPENVSTKKELDLALERSTLEMINSHGANVLVLVHYPGQDPLVHYSPSCKALALYIKENWGNNIRLFKASRSGLAPDAHGLAKFIHCLDLEHSKALLKNVTFTPSIRAARTKKSKLLLDPVTNPFHIGYGCWALFESGNLQDIKPEWIHDALSRESSDFAYGGIDFKKPTLGKKIGRFSLEDRQVRSYSVLLFHI